MGIGYFSPICCASSFLFDWKVVGLLYFRPLQQREHLAPSLLAHAHEETPTLEEQ